MLDKWIGYYENIMNDKQCKEIFNYPWDWTPSKYENNSGVSSNSEERVKMDETCVQDINKPYPLIREIVLKIVDIYAKEHERFSCIHHTNFRINKYGVGGFMSSHVDNIHHSHHQQYGYPQCSVLLFLNDDYEGGEFYVAEKEFKPEKGSAIIFPSNFMYPHEAKKITKGNRWSVVAWLM